MRARGRRLSLIGGMVVLGMGSAVIYLRAVTGGPDRDISFFREVPSSAAPEVLGRALGDVSTWPKWFHAMAEARVVDSADHPTSDQRLATDARLRLMIDPKKGINRKFTLYARVTEYVPQKKIRLEIRDDS